MIIYSVSDGIAQIKLNRPEKHNALHPDLIKNFKEKLKSAEEDKNIRILIITGEGKSFCAGADLSYLNDLRDYSSLDNENDSKLLADLFLKIYNFPKPTIAAVNGAAIAGGCGLASVCDIIIADQQHARFGYSEVKIGFIPAIVSIFLMRKIGVGRARHLLLTGEIIDAESAFQIGLVNYLSENVNSFSFELAKRLMSNSDFSMSFTKQMINNLSTLSVEKAVEYCIELNTISRTSDDFKKGLLSFINKK
ncbi:MAG TPA: enoyl-CoA hydratase/isomerase family protein [Ignavibacteriaceae bacterium]|nr:enoyl-CoA hydratase/isomerase family protein [Ignavibacteriaceae bacterium]